MDDTEQYSKDEEMFDAAYFEAKQSDVQNFLNCGIASTPLRQQLEIFTAPAPTPEHNLHPSSKTCVKCIICVEDGGKTFLEKKQLDCFKARIWRQPLEDDPTRYRYKINYIENPHALPLPNNYQASYMQHQSLRKTFDKLEPEAQAEFTERLTQGINKKYWQVVPEEDAIAMRMPPGPVVVNEHYLPANFELKTQGTTQACLVLDPSGLLNQKLLKAPNLEKPIQNVKRRTQCIPVLCCMDIREALFRITLSPESSRLSMFLMDLNTKTGELAPKQGPDTKLVTVRNLVLIMGTLQSPAFLGLSLEDLATHIPDPILQHELAMMKYLDDLMVGIITEEILALQQHVDLGAEDLPVECEDEECCSQGDIMAIKEGELGVPTPQDEQWCTRYLMQGRFGQKLLH